MRFSAADLTSAAVRVLGTFAVTTVVAIVALSVLVWSWTRSAPDAPVTTFGAPLAGVVALPTQEAASSVALSQPIETWPSRRQRNVPVTMVTSPRSVPSWIVALAMAGAASNESTTSLDASVGRTNVRPPESPSPPERESASITTPSEAPRASTPEEAARTARTAAVRSVVDRYRDAFDALDANAVEACWPGVDRRALERTFAQRAAQHIQFGRCDIQLAGVRAFESCNGYLQYTRKSGSRVPQLELLRWTFTLGEVKDGWVVLSLDARQTR
jgi:hypothetical protein